MAKLTTIALGTKVGDVTKIKFKNGETYEIVKWDKDVYGFKEAPFYRQMHHTWEHHCWSSSDLKKYLEKWWKENAPDELVANFNVTIPSADNVFGNDLPEWQKHKKGETQFAYFKDWRNRLIALKGEHHTTWWWTKSPNSGSTNYFVCVGASGAVCVNGAYYSNGVVPCFLKK